VILESGEIGRQANGAILIRDGETVSNKLSPAFSQSWTRKYCLLSPPIGVQTIAILRCEISAGAVHHGLLRRRTRPPGRLFTVPGQLQRALQCSREDKVLPLF